MKKVLSVLLAVMMMAALLAACTREDPANTPPASTPAGNSQAASTPAGDGTAPAGSPDVVSQGVSDTTIKIATIANESGAWAFIGQPAFDGLRACIDRLNAQGGILGRQIELIKFDDQFDGAMGHSAIQRFVEQDEVFMLASLGAQNLQSVEYMREMGIPVINMSIGLDQMYSESDPANRIFQVQPANRIDVQNLYARTFHEPIFGPNKDEVLPADAKVGYIHGGTADSLESLPHFTALAEAEGRLENIIIETVTADTFASTIQKFKSEGVQAIIYNGMGADAWIAAMDDAMYEVPVIFSYGNSTLQSFVPDTYKPGRPVYATVWGDYGTDEGQAMLDDMVDALTYTDIDAATQASYRDNNYCVAGYAYGMTLVSALQRYNEHEGEYGLNWDDFVKIMELESFFLGSAEYSYANGKRMGIDTMAFLEYVADPAAGTEEMISLRGFETVDAILAK